MTIENGNTVSQVSNKDQKLQELAMALIKHKTPEIVIVQFLSISGYDEEKINKIIAELQATENLWNVHVS